MIGRIDRWVCLAAITVPLISAQRTTGAHEQLAGSAQFGREWWESARNDEKQGFVVGHEDCFVWEGKHTRTTSLADRDLVKAIDSFLHNPTHKGDSVLQAIDSIAGVAPWHSPKPESRSGGETWTEPHWYLDGTWWRGGSETEHLGYVEGYLACYAGIPNSLTMIPDKPQQYVEGIDAFYARSAKNESAKVGTVLMKLATRENK